MAKKTLIESGRVNGSVRWETHQGREEWGSKPYTLVFLALGTSELRLTAREAQGLAGFLATRDIAVAEALDDAVKAAMNQKIIRAAR